MSLSEQKFASSSVPISLAKLSPKDKSWNKHKVASLKLSHIFAKYPKRFKQSERMAACSNILHFDKNIDSLTGEINYNFRGAMLCRIRTCPICQWRRSLVWRARFYKILPEIYKSNPTLKYIFLTLTVANCKIENLKDILSQMSKAWAKMRQYKDIENVVAGWVRTVEVTKEKKRKGYAHPHYHILLAVKPSYFSRDYIAHADYMAMWRKALGVEYDPRIDIRHVRGKGVKSGGVDRAGVIETLKYSVKSSDLLADESWTYELSLQIAGSRAIASGGLFKEMLKGLDDPVTEAEEMITLGSEKLAEATDEIVRFLFDKESGEYVEIKEIDI